MNLNLLRRSPPSPCMSPKQHDGEGVPASPGEPQGVPLAARRLFAPALVLLVVGLVLCGQALWIHAKARLAQFLLEGAFVETLASGHPVKPWTWADTWPVARIEIVRLSASAVVLAGSSGQALAFGPGHVARTPRAGEPGTAVYSGHRDTHFAFLADVRPGDEIR